MLNTIAKNLFFVLPVFEVTVPYSNSTRSGCLGPRPEKHGLGGE